MHAERPPVDFCHATTRDVSPETIFESLDGNDYQIDGQRCHVEVYGIFDDGRHVWVQVVLDGDERRMVTVRLRENDDQAGCTVVSTAPDVAA